MEVPKPAREAYYVMKFCEQRGWRPWEFYGCEPDEAWNAAVFAQWAVMSEVEAEHKERQQKLEEAKANARRQR